MDAKTPEKSPETKLIEASSTPALFARHASRNLRYAWIMAAHLSLIDAAVIQTIRAGQSGVGPNVLIIEAPPRHGKSELICRYLPAWYLGTFPENRCLLCMNTADLAATYGRKARDVMTEHGPAVFGMHVRGDSRAVNHWDLADHEGGMLTAGAGTAIQGRGGHLIIIDDPIKGHEQAGSESEREKQWTWYQGDVHPRLEPGGCVVIVSTRWHEEDVSGRLIRNSKIDSLNPVRRLRLPAIAEADDALGRQPGEPLWPHRFPLAQLEKTRAEMSPWIWNALYQQKPGRHEGAMFPDHYFGDHIWVDALPATFDVSAIAVDPSIGKEARPGDFSAIVFIGVSRGLIYVWADLARRPPSKIVDDVIKVGDSMNPTFLGIESNGFQEVLSEVFDLTCQIRQRPPLRLSQIVNTENKAVRILRLDRHLARKVLRFVRCEGCTELVKQLRMFPDKSAHDDGPDALEMAVRLAEQGSAINTVPEEEAIDF
jgi:predicted phage terminase large subunit-like protein